MSQTPETTPESSSALGAKRSSRKSHRKSRNGCDDCKRRRIKCDEQKPACSNCLKHSSRCSFLRHVLPNPVQSSLSTQSSLGPAQIAHLFHGPISPPKSSSLSPFTESRTTPSTVQIPAELTLPAILPSRPNATINIADLELLHNYDTSTSYTLATIPALQNFFRLSVPRIAFSHPFLLHAILGISALHLAHFKKDIRSHYWNQAQYQYQTALRKTPSPSAISKDTYSALYLFSTFCAFFTFGLGPRPGDFLLFGDHGLAEGLVLLRDMKTLLESHPEILEKSDLSPLLGIATRPELQPSSNNQHLDVLRQLIVGAPSGTADREIYLAALEALASSFPPSSSSGARLSQTSPQTAFIWMYRLSDEFLACLQRREPIALVILAHFCVLMNDLSFLWCMKGWVDHLLSEIHRSLDEKHRMWMDWPMEEIGWIPSS